jgi:selenocysteine lyase/cysteine desulfurase
MTVPAAAVPSLADLDALRRTEFPLASRHAFLNHASDSPMPVRTAALMAERVAVLQDPPREIGQREGYATAARRRLGAMLNMPPQQVAFLPNAADAAGVVANGLDWLPGDEILVVEQEFSSFVYPWKNLERYGVVTRVVPKRDGRTDPALIAEAMTPRTRLLAISDVEYQDGFRNDLAALGAICRERDILFVIDASQSLGSVHCDAAAWQADVVLAVGYKWLMGMHGIGVLAVSEPAMARIRPSAPGRLSVSGAVETSDYALDWQPDARRYQTGAPNWLGILALAESAGLVEDLGAAACQSHSRALSDLLITGLQARGLSIVSDLDPARRSHIVAFTTGSRAGDEALAARLAERDVILSLRGLGLRASVHFWNNGDDISRLLQAIG